MFSHIKLGGSIMEMQQQDKAFVQVVVMEVCGIIITGKQRTWNKRKNRDKQGTKRHMKDNK